MTKGRLERFAGLILLGFAVPLIIVAGITLVQVLTRTAEERVFGLVGLGQLAVVILSAAGLAFLAAAVGVLRGQSANPGFGETGPAEWFAGLVPVVVSWIAFAALVLARKGPAGATAGNPEP